MPYLDSIRVAGYKSIRDQEVELRSLNLLIGANGAGKSNFIGVFRFLNQIGNNKLQISVAQSGGADQILHFGRKMTERLLLDLRFGRNTYSFSLLPVAGDTLVFSNEKVFFSGEDGSLGAAEDLGSGHKETRLGDETIERIEVENIADDVLNALLSWKVYHFHDTGPSAKVKQTSDLDDNVGLRPDGGNLAAFLYFIQQTRADFYRNIVDVIRMVAPFFGSFSLRPDRLNPEKIRLEWQEKGSDGYFDAHALSDGTLRFMSLATLLLQPDLPATVLLDEPELGLHPYAISVLADLLRSAATRTQVVVSTQSVTLVNQFAPEDVIVVDRVGGESTFRRLESEKIAAWMDDYSLGELWEKNVLGGRPGS